MMLLRLGAGLGLFVGSLAAGWWLHRQHLLTEARASRIIRLLVVGPSPLALCLAFWKMNLRSPEPWLLPFLGLLIACSTLAPALLYAKRATLPDSQTGSFLTCALFSNVGYLGAYAAFAVFGEAAYALCMLYLVFFTPCFYTLGFWIASRYGGPAVSSGFAAVSDDKLRLYPFLGMLAGIVLNLARVARPLPLEWLNHALIPVNTGLYLMAIGSQLTFASPTPWLRPCWAMSGIKFFYTPLVAWLLVSLFHIQGLPRFVVLLEASAPVAVSPLMFPLLFRLDRKLANALWLFTTIAAVPWTILILPLLTRL